MHLAERAANPIAHSPAFEANLLGRGRTFLSRVAEVSGYILRELCVV